MRLLVSIGMILLLFQFGFAGDGKPEGKKYGAGTTLTDTTAVSKLLGNPQAYAGKKVLIKGRVINACKKRGCWMELAGDKDYQSIRIKVNDGEIVFPFESKGKMALAEGEVEIFEMSMEQTRKYLQHEAECNGDPFDPASVTKPHQMVQIKGTGAVIYQ